MAISCVVKPARCGYEGKGNLRTHVIQHCQDCGHLLWDVKSKTGEWVPLVSEKEECGEGNLFPLQGDYDGSVRCIKHAVAGMSALVAIRKPLAAVHHPSAPEPFEQDLCQVRRMNPGQAYALNQYIKAACSANRSSVEETNRKLKGIYWLADNFFKIRHEFAMVKNFESVTGLCAYWLKQIEVERKWGIQIVPENHVNIERNEKITDEDLVYTKDDSKLLGR